MKLTQETIDKIRAAKREMDTADADHWLAASMLYSAWLKAHASDLCDLAEDALAWRAEVETLRRLEKTDTLPACDAVQ